MINSTAHTPLVSALFVRQNSIYKDLGIDCYDINRDARLFDSNHPIIAHPPCRAWGRLSYFAKPREDEADLAIWAINQIRLSGGVLEHPLGSKLWKHMNLPTGRDVDEFGGYTLSINQHWFGHNAQKKTLLYICGCPMSDLPPMPLRFDCIEFVISTGYRKGHQNWRPSVKVEEREATPVELAKWLVKVALLCKK
jgi:hypothetical protein